ncbi:MAG: hypothetical protein IJA35_04905 [Clostridia bacterium]|nr:hypothetical protein [Clostridia bacterium]
MQTYNDVVRSNKNFAYTLSDSPHADEVKSRVSIAETDAAEDEFSKLLKLIPDADLRERLDQAAGRISYAYEKLGFIEGYIAERAYGCII